LLGAATYIWPGLDRGLDTGIHERVLPDYDGANSNWC